MKDVFQLNVSYKPADAGLLASLACSSDVTLHTLKQGNDSQSIQRTYSEFLQQLTSAQLSHLQAEPE